MRLPFKRIQNLRVKCKVTAKVNEGVSTGGVVLSGAGLAMAKSIAKLKNGKIDVAHSSVNVAKIKPKTCSFRGDMEVKNRARL